MIRAEGIGKQYRIGEAQERNRTLRDALAGAVSGTAHRLGALVKGTRVPRDPPRMIWALQDVSFEVNHGEAMGIIGANGAGKSTLLKILSRITEPTTGTAEVRGRVGSLLEVGTGFHSELTGRENTYLSGAILGMPRAEIDRKFDEIVEFAEVSQFIDTPVKHYSSGMYLRLAFSVAAHLEPEVLIVDEVLAVGDARFQQKCLGKMGTVARQGRTVLFVSHNLTAISSLCTTALVLEGGRVVARGSPDECIEHYSALVGGGDVVWKRPEQAGTEGALVITSVSSALQGEQPHLVLEMEIQLASRRAHRPAHLALTIYDSMMAPLMQAIPRSDGYISDSAEVHRLEMTVDLPPLVPGRYLATVWVGSHNTETLDEVSQVIAFEVAESPIPDRTFPHSRDRGYQVAASSVRRLDS